VAGVVGEERDWANNMTRNGWRAVYLNNVTGSDAQSGKGDLEGRILSIDVNSVVRAGEIY
jgi:hypothetical protein